MSARAASTNSVDVAEVGDVVRDDRRAARARAGQRACGGPRRGHPILWQVLRAVLFDWGDTLFHFAYDEELLEAGWRGRPRHARARRPPGRRTRRPRVFRERYLPLLLVPGSVDEVEYPEMVRELLGGFGRRAGRRGARPLPRAPSTPPGIRRRLTRRHTHALLDSLRERGLLTGLVSNAFDPGWLLHHDLAAMGLAERLDAAVFSSEVGKRKPHPAIFEAALRSSASRRRTRSSSATAATRTCGAPRSSG